MKQIEQFETENHHNLDQESRITLNSFYMQLSSHPIFFTMLGFFNINLNLLAQILTGVTSFQIILVQFQAS